MKRARTSRRGAVLVSLALAFVAGAASLVLWRDNEAKKEAAAARQAAAQVLVEAAREAIAEKRLGPAEEHLKKAAEGLSDTPLKTEVDLLQGFRLPLERAKLAIERGELASAEQELAGVDAYIRAYPRRIQEAREADQVHWALDYVDHARKDITRNALRQRTQLLQQLFSYYFDGELEVPEDREELLGWIALIKSQDPEIAAYFDGLALVRYDREVSNEAVFRLMVIDRELTVTIGY